MKGNYKSIYLYWNKKTELSESEQEHNVKDTLDAKSVLLNTVLPYNGALYLETF